MIAESVVIVYYYLLCRTLFHISIALMVRPASQSEDPSIHKQ